MEDKIKAALEQISFKYDIVGKKKQDIADELQKRRIKATAEIDN